MIPDMATCFWGGFFYGELTGGVPQSTPVVHSEVVCGEPQRNWLDGGVGTQVLHPATDIAPFGRAAKACSPGLIGHNTFLIFSRCPSR